MRTGLKFAWMLAILVSAAPLAVGKPVTEDERSVIIVFKDGHQQKIPLDQVARIEFSTPVSASTAARGRFQGEWKVGVGDGTSDTFRITLKSDGAARKTIGGPNGTWTVVNGEARISWEDGWHDVIRKAGRKYEKAAYSPGTSYDDHPTSVSEAEYTEPN